MLSFFSSLFNGDVTTAKDVDVVEIEDTRSAEAWIKTQDVFHNTQDLEKEILHTISSGDIERLMQILPDVQGSDASSGSFPGGPIRTLKNIFITSAALCSRAAVAGGMDYDHALTLSDNYISKVELMKTGEEIIPQIGMMMAEYCDQVARLRQPQDCSALTKQIIADVHAHLHEPVTVEEIAERCHLSVSYVTHTFSKDMGISLKTYIQQQKINEAKRLLTTSKRSIAEVASLLGFSSQAHFQTVFRKVIGTTPHAYRNEHGA